MRKTKRQRRDDIAGKIVGIPRNITRVGLTPRELVDIIRLFERSTMELSATVDFFARAGLIELNQGGVMLRLIPDDQVDAVRAQVRAARRGILSRIRAAWGRI